MPRPEGPITGSGPRAELARELRRLRGVAGSPPYRVLATKIHFSAPTLSRAASPGAACPTWEVVEALGGVLDGDLSYLNELWRGALEDASGSDSPTESGTDTHPDDRREPVAGARATAAGRSDAGGPDASPSARPPISDLPRNLDTARGQVAQRLREIFQGSSFNTQAAAARAMNYSPGYLADLLSGRRSQSQVSIARFIDICIPDPTAAQKAMRDILALLEPYRATEDQADSESAPETTGDEADRRSEPHETANDAPRPEVPPGPASPSRSVRRRSIRFGVALLVVILVGVLTWFVTPNAEFPPATPLPPLGVVDSDVVASTAPFDLRTSALSGKSQLNLYWNTCDPPLRVTLSVGGATPGRSYMIAVHALIATNKRSRPRPEMSASLNSASDSVVNRLDPDELKPQLDSVPISPTDGQTVQSQTLVLPSVESRSVTLVVAAAPGGGCVPITLTAS